jgi:hypothetical protein
MHRITADTAPERLRPTTIAAAGITEADLQGWIIADPGIIDDDLLIITAEYGGFEGLRDRLDLLALDPSGTVVLIELKRDRADATTDLQALKYASYCATLGPLLRGLLHPLGCPPAVSPVSPPGSLRAPARPAGGGRDAGPGPPGRLAGGGPPRHRRRHPDAAVLRLVPVVLVRVVGVRHQSHPRA